MDVRAAGHSQCVTGTDGGANTATDAFCLIYLRPIRHIDGQNRAFLSADTTFETTIHINNRHKVTGVCKEYSVFLCGKQRPATAGAAVADVSRFV